MPQKPVAHRVIPLPVRIRPLPSEDSRSFIIRLARANHIQPRHLRAYLCEPPRHSGRPTWERLADAAGRTAKSLKRVLTDGHCPECNSLLPTSQVIGRPAQQCSAGCRRARHQRLHPRRPRPPLLTYACEKCARPFSSRRARRWCLPCRRRGRDAA
ncbi:hypothetical protein GCM10010430_02150 [Kitasatospora cystarginea]|uniref:TniQ domain-containing protein n=1 Tax=Kitasatospora cystarginea TaxID=58350 RepID=A0ABN3DBB2_9ACTN